MIRRIFYSRSVRRVTRALVLLLLCRLGTFAPLSAGAELKIFISTDLEGVSGVYKFAQTREKDAPLNIQACEYFMGDLGAVIRGLRAGGATGVVVLDGHGSKALIPHLMEPGAKYITGVGKSLVQIFDPSFAGLVMFGFHAMMGTADGVLNHTQNSRRENRYWYNGVESGELVQSALKAGLLGVPPIMVTGDEATCREARRFFGEAIVTVATKRGLARENALLYPFEENRRALYEGARRAMAAIPKCRPYKITMPIRAKLQALDRDAGLPGAKVVTKEWVSESGENLTSPPK